MEQVAEQVYRLDIPLAGSPLREIHNFLILGSDRHLLVDTAFNTDACEEAVLSQMAELEIDINDVDIFLTHMHVDHSGLIARLKRPGNTIYTSVKDHKLVDNFQNPEHWDWITNSNTWTGVPEEYALKAEQHIAYKMRPSTVVPIADVEEGTSLQVGQYHFTVIDLPGHTPGQIGLWEESQGMLFCGDHILANITPNITAWDLDGDYLGAFFDSLQKVRKLPVKRLFPAHRLEPENINQRIDELREHHNERLKSILSYMRENQNPVTAFDIALQLEWNSTKPLLEMVPQQRWFACSESLAHLQYLYVAGKLNRSQRNETLYYTLNH